MRKLFMFPKALHLVAGISLLLLFLTPVQASAQAGQGLEKGGFTTNGSLSGSTKMGWSGAIGISPVCQPDPTRGSQLNDVAVNANGLTIAAWDQYTYATGGPYTVGVAIQSGGRWSAPFTISGTTGFSMDPRVAVGADGTMAVSWVYQDAALTQQKMQVAVKSPSATTKSFAAQAQR